MSVQRQVMRFFLPNTISDLFQVGTDAADRGERTETVLYLNPEQFKITEKKLINKQLTKGGYVVQYWGEDLPIITASGTTGSGGIEAINILRAIYRHEQIAFAQLLSARLLGNAAEFEEQVGNIPEATTETDITSLLDSLTGGGFTQIVDGISSTIQAVTNSFNGTSRPLNPVSLIPNIGSFAVSIDLYFQGEKYRGYFTDFDVTESADSLGLFNYSFTFVVTKRFGIRTNFMPWHRKPTDDLGVARQASIPIEGAREDELSYQPEPPPQSGISVPRSNEESVVGDTTPNNVGPSRYSNVTGS